MRSSGVGDHLIFYRVVGEKLEIMHVLHGGGTCLEYLRLTREMNAVFGHTEPGMLTEIWLDG
jgi:hypothetical protein